MLPQTPQIRTLNPDVDRALTPIVQNLNAMAGVPFLNGRLITSVVLPDATNINVAHALGRRFAGWSLCDITGPTAAGCVQRIDTGDPTSTLVLKASGYGATVTVSLWVF